MKEEPLNSPITLEATEKGSTLTASSVVRSNLSLAQNCSPLVLQQTEFLLMDQAMGEVLTGRPFLKALGFSLESHLEATGSVLHNAEFDTKLREYLNNRFSVKAARSSSSGIQYITADSDPIPPPETAEAAMGVDPKEEM